MSRIFRILAALLSVVCRAQTPLQADLTNGLVRAVIELPNAQRGSYRGTRFDWAGIVSSLQYAGHEYTGAWHDVHDPLINDAVTGPAEEFLTNDSALGYDVAKPGDTFPRIGVGALRKPAGETTYKRFITYEIVDPGEWRVKGKRDQIELTHRLQVGGYSYVYSKTLRLIKGKPQLAISHMLKNTGSQPIETSQYSHNFFAMDHQVVGPDVSVRFSFVPKPKTRFQFGAVIEGQAIAFTRELETKQTASADIDGFGSEAKAYDIHVENRRTGTAVRITADQPLEKLHFWSIRTVACPEPYIHLNVAPGKTVRWTIKYELSASSNSSPAKGGS